MSLAERLELLIRRGEKRLAGRRQGSFSFEAMWLEDVLMRARENASINYDNLMRVSINELKSCLDKDRR